MAPLIEKPEELVKAMEAIQNACKAVHADFGKDPLGEKPANLGPTTQVKKEMVYEVVKELYKAVNNISDYLAIIGHKADATEDKVT